MDNILNILICEDNQLDKEHLLSILDANKIDTKYQCFNSGEDLLNTFKPHTFDLLLIDIYMNGINGIETLFEVRKIDRNIPVAFITSSTEHTLDSYRLSVLKYIEKPYDSDQIDEILNLALIIKKNSPSITVKKMRNSIRISLKNIVYIEQSGHKCIIHLVNNENIQTYNKISEIENQISDDSFFNCHKSFLINLNYVSYIDYDLKCFVLENNNNIPIRRKSFSEARKILKNYVLNLTKLK